MVKEIRIYYEGDPRLREGFNEFLSDIRNSAREKRIKFNMIACKATPIRDFVLAVRTHRDAMNFLLIDSDGPDNGSLISSKVKAHSHWDSGVDSMVRDDQLHFMVQVMESWLLADREMLQRYYGQKFITNRLRGDPNHVEQVRKDDVVLCLETATQNTIKGKYHKTRHAPELLMRIDVNKVRDAAPSCSRLFDSLEGIILRA